MAKIYLRACALLQHAISVIPLKLGHSDCHATVPRADRHPVPRISFTRQQLRPSITTLCIILLSHGFKTQNTSQTFERPKDKNDVRRPTLLKLLKNF